MHFIFVLSLKSKSYFFFPFESCRISCIKEHVPFRNNNTHHHHIQKWYRGTYVYCICSWCCTRYIFIYIPTHHQSSSAKRPITCKCPKKMHLKRTFSLAFSKEDEQNEIFCLVKLIYRTIYIFTGWVWNNADTLSWSMCVLKQLFSVLTINCWYTYYVFIVYIWCTCDIDLNLLWTQFDTADWIKIFSILNSFATGYSHKKIIEIKDLTLQSVTKIYWVIIWICVHNKKW